MDVSLGDRPFVTRAWVLRLSRRVLYPPFITNTPVEATSTDILRRYERPQYVPSSDACFGSLEENRAAGKTRSTSSPPAPHV